MWTLRFFVPYNGIWQVPPKASCVSLLFQYFTGQSDRDRIRWGAEVHPEPVERDSRAGPKSKDREIRVFCVRLVSNLTEGGSWG